MTALAAERLGGRLPPGLREVLLRAGGPLFIDGFLHVLIDSGRLSRSGEGWALTDGEVKVPPAVRDVILERLDGLEPAPSRPCAATPGLRAARPPADPAGMPETRTRAQR